MKKLGMTLMAATAMFFTVQTASAQVEGQDRTTMEQRTQQQEDYQQVEVSELPSEVQQAVERDFQGSTVSEAHVRDQQGEKSYKIVISTQDGQSRELYADAQGNWIDNQQ